MCSSKASGRPEDDLVLLMMLLWRLVVVADDP
jgi:hypothetical protein